MKNLGWVFKVILKTENELLQWQQISNSYSAVGLRSFSLLCSYKQELNYIIYQLLYYLSKTTYLEAGEIGLFLSCLGWLNFLH